MKGQQLKFFDIAKEGHQKHCFSVPLEAICISTVIVVLLLIVSFVLGIEKGKRLKAGPFPRQLEAREPEVSVKVTAPPDQADRQEKKEEPEPAALSQDPVQEPETVPVREARAPETSLDKQFTIQVASFKDRASAEKEKAQLRGKGYLADIYQKGEYLVIFVGQFTTKDSAKDQISKLKEHYTDCFVRRF